MAKINITINNTTYSVEESALSTATSDLRNHLSTTMSGTGASIDFGGTTYNIDSDKLSVATNEFISHLGTIAGSGSSVVVNGVEYGIDSTKLAGAISDIEAVLAGTGEERLEGDGAEYYTLAPTALSFRSTAPLNELQEVQINGVTVDPANYTLEEGSTIVTFPIDYLKTLDVGNYEVAVASDSKTVKGDFTVAAPELNEHGFYYNQPYTAYVAALGGNISCFFRADGTLDFINMDTSYTEICYFTSENKNVVITGASGTFNCTVSADGMGVYCAELDANFVMGDESIVADEDYIYFYDSSLGGYNVTAIDKTKSSYNAIKTGINGKQTVALAANMFVATHVGSEAGNPNLVIAPTIPNTVTIIGENAFCGCTSLTGVTIPDSVTRIDDTAFQGCESLESITFKGTMEQWGAISKGGWGALGFVTTVVCSDGTVSLA